MSIICLQEAIKMKGVLSKESPKLFGGYQARFFQIIEANKGEGDGHLLAYFEKEGGQLKGAIPFNEIGDVISINKKEFSFMMSDRIFKLKADNEKLKNLWIESLQTVKEHDRNLKEKKRGNTKDEGKSWKIENQTKEVVEAISKQGISINKNSDLSEKLLETKGIKKQLRGVNPEQLKTRIKHGFLLKRHKYTQKRWFFIVSARPLSLKNQILDESTLDESSLPSSVKFDTLYYFSAEDERDASGAKGEIMLGQSSKIELKQDEEGGFFFIIDMNDRIYEFGSDQSWERDSWYDSLINSRQTSKDVMNSITKRPRCVISLAKFFELEGATKIEKIAESEAQLILKDFNEIKDLQMLNILIKKLDSKLIPTLDGCRIFTPPQYEIMKAYAQVFNNSIFQKVTSYWKYLSENLSTLQLLELADVLYLREDKLADFGISDHNFGSNSKEIVKIFTRKTMQNLNIIVDSILKNERQYKASSSNDDEILLTNGPQDLFKMFSTTMDMIRKFKIKFLFEEVLRMFKECQILYMIGVDIVISRADLIVENEFLIGICNNAVKFSGLNSGLVEDCKKCISLNDKEIEQLIGQKEVLNSINFISETAMSRLVFELSSPIEQEVFAFKNVIDLKFEKIFEVVHQVYEPYSKQMHFSTSKRYWAEITNFLVINYIRFLLTKSMSSSIPIEKIKNKIKSDKKAFMENFTMLGESQLEETTKIIESIYEFLSSDIEVISFTCSNIVSKMGNCFTIDFADALISMRTDWSRDNKNEALETCKEFLNTMINSKDSKLTNRVYNRFLSKMSSELSNERRATVVANPQELDTSNISGKTLVLEDFLAEPDEEEFSECGSTQDKSLLERQALIKAGVTSNVSTNDIIKEGWMKKKSNSKYQERFFQLKNGGLYWYSSQTSIMATNFLLLSDLVNPPFLNKPTKFIIETDKVYKFECPNASEASEWVELIKSELKKLKKDKKVENQIHLPLQKMVITFHEEALHHISAFKSGMKDKILEAMKSERFFRHKSKKTHQARLDEANENQDKEKPRSRMSVSQSIDEEPKFYSKQNYLEPFQVSGDSESKKNSLCLNCWTRFTKIFK